MRKSIHLGAVTLGFALLAMTWTPAVADEFYAGKTIRFVVGAPAGGGYDTFTRTIARHLGKHIPGNPAMVVDNMEGAGSLIAANHVYNKADPDGLSIGVWISGQIIRQALGDRIEPVPGEDIDGYVKQIYSLSDKVKHNLGFLVRSTKKKSN